LIDQLPALVSYQLTTNNLNKFKSLKNSNHTADSNVHQFKQNIEISTSSILNVQETLVEKNENKDRVEFSIENKTSIKETIYYPNKENSLFWSIYILVYGLNDYLQIGQKYGNRELEEKQKMIESFKKHPQSLKQLNHRITNVMVQEILSELMIQKKSSLLCFMAMVVYYQKNVYILKEKTYLKFFANSEWDMKDSDDFSHFAILRYNEEEDQYGIDWEVNVEKIEDIERHWIELESIEKPLKGVSSFKVSDLNHLASLLWRDHVLEEAILLKKPDLYQKLYDACIWNTGLSLQKKMKTKMKRTNSKPKKD
jgi:hypothetical protein